MPQIVPLELLVISALVLVIPVYLAWRAVAKTGNNGALGLLVVVPLANILLLAYLALSEWPIERRLKALSGRSGSDMSTG